MSEGLTITGVEEFISRLSPTLLDKPLRRLLTRAAMYAQGSARERAPVDTGLLRSSIAYEIEAGEAPLWAKVGTSVFYAASMEYGTGTQNDGEGGGGEHWPPSGALSEWAHRHGIPNGFLAARAIGRRGGLRPRRFLRGGLADLLDKMPTLLEQFIADVVTEWER